jgi:hypothetical protein
MERVIGEAYHEKEANVWLSSLELRQTQCLGTERLQNTMFSIARCLSASLLTITE